MAEIKKKRVIKKTETIREKATKKTDAAPKRRRLRNAANSVSRPLKTVHRLSQKEYHPIKLPDNKAGRFLTTGRRVTPSFFREAWAEVRQVKWPNRSETTKLTIAVLIFAITFGTIIAVVDYGLDNLFRELILK